MSSARHMPLCRGVGFLLIVVLSLLPGTTPTVGHATSAPLTGWTPEAMMQVKNVANVQISPDGHRVVFTVVGAGITNLMSFTGTTDIPDFLPGYLGAELWEHLDLYSARSPLFHVKGVSTPTLIQHGEADARVPIAQGYELYSALKRQNVPVKMVVSPRAPHGPQEPKQVLDIMKRNVEWFNHYLRKDESAAR
jgi:acetyl esterase/lipase